MGIRLLCPLCYSPDIIKDEQKISETGKDCFVCDACEYKFGLEVASYETSLN